MRLARVVIAGAINMDLIGKANRLPRRSETLLGNEFYVVPGGKGANQAVAARRAGAQTTLVGSVGSDRFGADVIAFLGREKLDLRVARRDSPNGVALVLVGGTGENLILVVAGANDKNEVAQIAELDLTGDDIVLLQGEISDDVNVAFVERARARGSLIVLNLSPFRGALAKVSSGVDYLILNELEFAELAAAERPVADPDQVMAMLARTQLSAANIIVTLGGQGVVARIDGYVEVVRAHPVPVVDTTGAGDCFCGAFAAMLALGQSAAAALQFANAAAGLSVQRIGAAGSMPLREDVERFLSDSRAY